MNIVGRLEARSQEALLCSTYCTMLAGLVSRGTGCAFTMNAVSTFKYVQRAAPGIRANARAGVVAAVSIASASCTPRAAPSARRDPGEVTLTRLCVGCHDGEVASRPNLSGAISPELATRAMQAILAQEMPPPRSADRARLDGGRRAELLDWLCTRTGRDAEVCDRLARFETSPPLTRMASTILLTIGRLGTPPLSEQTKTFVTMSSPTNPQGYTGPRQTVLDSRLVAVLLVAAAEACGPKQDDPRRAAAREACIAKVLTTSLEAPAPTPPAPNGGGAR